MMKWIQQIRSLPVRYCCNYALLGGMGMAFETLVFAIRQAGVQVSRPVQSLAAAAMLVVIPQTAAEYFRPEGEAGFLVRFCVSVAHLVFFCFLVLLQLDLDLPLFTIGEMLLALYFTLAYCEVRYHGKGLFILLPLLFFCIFLLLPAMDAIGGSLLSDNMLITGNIFLFLILYCTWGHYRKTGNHTKREYQQ